MNIDDIIRKHKEHLTNAQIRALSQASERYKQLNAGNRAQAYSSLHRGLTATRRGLQNVGLASRKGKIISGRQKSAQDSAQAAYEGYSRNLRPIERAYTERRAQQMANATMTQEYLQNLRDEQKKIDEDAAKIREEYEAAVAAYQQQIAAQQAAQVAHSVQNSVQQIAQQAAQQAQNAVQQAAHSASTVLSHFGFKNTQDYGVNHDRIGHRVVQNRPDVNYEMTDTGTERREAELARRNENAYNALKADLKANRNLTELDTYGSKEAQAERKQQQMKETAAAMREYEETISNPLKRFAASFGTLDTKRRTEFDSRCQSSPVFKEYAETMLQPAYEQVDANKQRWDAEIQAGNAYDGRIQSQKQIGYNYVRTETGAFNEDKQESYQAYKYRYKRITTPIDRNDPVAQKAEKARREQADAMSRFARVRAAIDMTDDQIALLKMDDSTFDVGFDAAKKLYEQAVKSYEQAEKYAGRNRGNDADDARDAAIDQLEKAEEKLKSATTAYANYEYVRIVRDSTSAESYYYDSYYGAANADAYKVDNVPSYHDDSWKGYTYNEEHGTADSKYAAVVNEYSLMMPNAAFNYSFAGDVRDIGDFFNQWKNIFSDNRTDKQDFNAWFDKVRWEIAEKVGTGTSAAKTETAEAVVAAAHFMTDRERDTYNAILANRGAKAADEYFEYLRPDLNDRLLADIQKENEFYADTHGFEGTLMSVPINLAKGAVDPVRTMLVGQQDPLTAKAQAMRYNSAANLREAVSRNFSDFGKFIYNTGMSMADSTTVGIIGGGIGKMLQGAGMGASLAQKAGSLIGGSLLGGSAFNSAYNDALQRGMNPGQARFTAVGNSVNEMLFESLSLDLLVGQFQKGGILKVSKNGFVNWLANTLVQGGVEGSEEVFTDIGNRLWDDKINGIMSEELTKLRKYIANGISYEEAKKKVNAEYAEQLGMSFVGGIVSGGVMGGGATFLGMVKNRGFEKIGSKMSTETKTEVRNFGFKSEQAQEILNQGKLTNQDYGVLYSEMIHQQFEEGRAYVQNAVKDGTITKEQKELYDKYAQMAKDGTLTAEVVASDEYAKDMESLDPVFDIMDEGEMIQQGLRDLAEAHRAVRVENEKYDKQIADIENDTTLTDAEKQQRIDAIENERGENVTGKVKELEEVQNRYNENVKTENGKVDTKRGNLTYDFTNAKTFDEMSDRQKAAIRFAKLFADKYGTKIHVVDDSVAGQRVDGEYDSKTNTITVNISGSNSVMYTVSHEMTHWLQHNQGKAYNSLKSAINNELARTDLVVSELPNVYQDVMGDYKTADNTVYDALVKYEQDMYKRQTGEELSRERAEDEVIARCCESFLKDRGFAEKMVASNPGSARTIAARLRQLANDVQTLKEDALERGYEKYGELIDNSLEKAALEQIGDIEEIARIWENALNQAAKKATKKEKASIRSRVTTAVEQSGVVVNDKGEPVMNVNDHGDGGVQFSLSTYRTDGRAALDEYLKKRVSDGKLDTADAKDIKNQMDAIYELCEKYEGRYATFGAWSNATVKKGRNGQAVFSVIRDNSEYPMNIDFSLVCVKRRALDAVLNQVVKSGKMERLILDDKALVKVNDLLREKYNFETACAMCFVEAKRFRQTKVADTFVNMYNGLVKSLGGEASYFNFGGNESVQQGEGITNVPDSQLDFTKINELIDKHRKSGKKGMNVPTAIAYELKMNPESRKLLLRGDFMSTVGFDAVAENAPEVLKLYNRKKGTGGPKASFGDMQYLNDIETKSWTPERAYAVGGVRVQSFSDFVPRMFFDYAQMMADLAAGKLPAHAYTKEESFVKLFGLTGMKINMSLIPMVASDGLSAGLQYQRDANGDIVYKNGKPVVTYAWATESFSYETAKQIQADPAYGKNCGTICIGVSDEHIRMMMADPTIRMIIPYHKSSLNPEVAKLEHIDGFTDYSKQQRTYKDGKAVKVDFGFNQRLQEVGDPKAVANEYLEWCDENGYTPKFKKFAYNADGSMNENYYKLLEDFALYDEQGNYCPQGAVQMVYPGVNGNKDTAFGTLDTILEGALIQDDVKQTRLDTMAKQIAEDISKQSEKWRVERQVEAAQKKGKKSEAQYSMNDKDYISGRLGGQEYLKYLQLGKKVINETATDAEIKEFKQRMNALSQDNREAFLDKLREKMIRADEAAKVRDVRDRQIARLKSEFKESKEKARDRKIRSDLTATLKKGNDKIVKMLANPTENSHVPVQLAQAVSEYAQRLNQLLTTSEPKTGEFAGTEKQTKKGELNAQKILDALKRSYADEETIAALKAEDPKFDPRGLIPVQYDENGKMIKDESLAEMIKEMDEIIQGKHLNELTTDDLRFVLNTMRGVIHTVTDANKITIDGESRNVYRASRNLANEVKNASKVFGNKSNRITKFMNRYVIESLGLRRIAKLYSGSNENALFVKMVDDLNQGAIEQERIKQTLRRMFNEVTTKYAKEMDTWYGKKAEWIDTGFGFKITKGMRVSLAMHILNEQNLRNVEKAGLRIPDMAAYRKGNIKEAYKNGKVVRLTKAQAEQIVANMTEAEKAYFKVAKEFFHKRSGYYINRTSLKLLGFSKAIVENYFPIQTDDAYRAVKYDDVRQNASVEHPGFLETRKGTANVMYLNDITAVVNRQIDGVAKYAGLAIPMRNWNNIMNAWLFEENEDGEWVRSDDGRAHDVLERRMGYTNGKGKAIIDYVDQFISDLTSPGVRDANENVQAAEFAAKLTSNYVKAVLTLNARVALSQLASVPTAAAEIPWKYIVQSFGGNVEQHLNRNASNELIDQYTPIFAMRRAGTQTEVSEVMKRRGFADKAEQKLPGLLGWITGMDVAATRRLWYACERWVKGETEIPVGSDAFYKEVAKRYERVIQNTQPNFTVLQRSPALRSKNAAARIITMFGTQRMQNAGVFIESLAEVVQTKDKAKRKAAMKKFGRTLSGLITAAIVIGLERAFVSALRGRMRPLQDDDKDITAKSVSDYIMGEIGTSLAGSFMYVGEIYDFVHGFVSGITEGDSGYDNSFALPAAEALSTMIKFFKNKDWQYFEYMRGDHTDNEKWLKTRSFINELMTVASYATGLPLANASKTILNGTVPLVQDIVESTKTGELNLYLHQSGKLDDAKTAANYKEWTNLGKKGSTYFNWENKLKDAKSTDDKTLSIVRAEELRADKTLTNEERAMLLRMVTADATSEGAVVYNENGKIIVDFTNDHRYKASLYTKRESIAEALWRDTTALPGEKAKLLSLMADGEFDIDGAVVYTMTQNDKGEMERNTVVVDFTNLDRYRASTMLSDKQYEGFLNLVDMGVAEDIASTAFIQYKVQKKQGAKANDRFRDWLFTIVKNPEDRAKVDMAVIGNTVRVEGTIGYKENGEVYADYSSQELFDAYVNGKKQDKSDAIIANDGTAEAKAKAFADTDNNYHAKDGIVYNDKDKVVADFTSDEAYRASQLGEARYRNYNTAVGGGVSRSNAVSAVEQYAKLVNDDNGEDAKRYREWLMTQYNPKDRAILDAAFRTDANAKNGKVYNKSGDVVADYNSTESFTASQMGVASYRSYETAVGYGMTEKNALNAVKKHKEFTADDDKDNATQYTTWVFNTYKDAKDRAIAGAIYTTKPVTVKDGRTYDENGYIYRDYTSAAWYKLSNRTLSKDGVNKRYEAAKLLEKDGYTAEKTVAAYVELDKLSKKSEWQSWLKNHGYTNDQITIILWSRGWAKMN